MNLEGSSPQGEGHHKKPSFQPGHGEGPVPGVGRRLLDFPGGEGYGSIFWTHEL